MLFPSSGFALEIDDRGRIAAIVGAATGLNHAYEPGADALLCIREYGPDGAEGPALAPVSCEPAGGGGADRTLRLRYPGGGRVELLVRASADDVRMEVAAASSPAGVASVHWGPYRLALAGPVAEWIGMARTAGFSFGVLGLEERTVGLCVSGGWGDVADAAAAFEGPAGPGTQIHLGRLDCTRARRWTRGGDAFLSRPIPGRTAVGSAVAFWSAPSFEAELDAIERIVLREGLPHPTLGGVWAKRAPEAKASAVWADYNGANVSDWARLCERAGLHHLCRHNCWGRWGHFEPDPNDFPGGWDGLRRCSETAAAAGVRTTCYTLSNFTRPFALPEPFVAPVPDARLQELAGAAALTSEM